MRLPWPGVGARWRASASLETSALPERNCYALSESPTSGEASAPDDAANGGHARAGKHAGSALRPEIPPASSVSSEPGAAPLLYDALASWWPLLSAPDDYEEEAAFYQQTLIDACKHPPRHLLELGSGGGNNASHLKAAFDLTLVDLSPGMLEVSRRLNPECEHMQGDMRTVRLEREFDAVFVHDAVCYMTTEADLRAAITSAYVHCRPGGAALFAPDYVRETFRPSTNHGGHDGEERSLRYLEWTWDPDPNDATYVVDYAYLLRDRDEIRVVHDRHTEGLFSRNDWVRLLLEGGFRPTVVPFDHSEFEPGTLEVLVGQKDADGVVDPSR